MVNSAYIHIPFCKSKCKYCSFVSYNRPEMMIGYVYALLKDISVNYRGEELNTLYFGGGTPSLLPVDFLEKIIKPFIFSKNYEFTLEINPDDRDLDYFKQLKSLGVNRLSIGSQTFDDKILKLIGRRHNSEQITEAVNLAKEAGFENISVDLIYGLPTQTMDCLKKDLEKFLSLDIQHISTYGLKIEEESFWGKCYNRETNQLVLPDTDQIYLPPDEDEQADMYEGGVNKILENAGFYRYEVSNFAKAGFESRHNLNYWNNNEYYGFGAAAHGYVDGVRYSNYTSLEEYMAKPHIHECGRTLSMQEKLEEEIFLGFRKRSGVNVSEIDQKYGIDFGSKYRHILEKYSDFIEKTPSGYTFNLKGTLISNIILSEFI
ncbi:MAG: hypothetical protein BHW62_07860 [Acinetobacter sp. CAG:196_36_41]|nr:MAG: hypothetical protein BHW62_07860 [Acinetobacter sp. CAG:196_36_41]